MRLSEVRAELRAAADPKKAEFLKRFFKCGPGGYAEGDRFLGIVVPRLRALARRARALPLSDVQALLRSPWHEERFVALAVLVDRFTRAEEKERAALYRFYCRHLRWIDNWDLVDVSAPHVVGGYLLRRDRAPLYRLARSPVLWRRRVAMLATFAFIRADDHDDALRLAERLRDDPHDLMHKAVGWMLREVGKRDRARLEAFLHRHAARMPRTALRYAIEKFPPAERRRWLSRRAEPRRAPSRRME